MGQSKDEIIRYEETHSAELMYDFMHSEENEDMLYEAIEMYLDGFEDGQRRYWGYVEKCFTERPEPMERYDMEVE